MFGLGPRETAAVGALAIHFLVMFLIADVERPPAYVVTDMSLDEDPEPPPPEEEEPEPEPEPPPEEEKPEPEPEKAPEPKEAPPPEPKAAEPPPGPAAPEPAGEPAPGWAVEAPASDQPYTIDAVPIGQARAPGGRGQGQGKSGTGGRGGGTDPAATGGGGDGTVSVASIKTMPQPIGDTDFVDATRDYPPDAKRLGIEGQVRVRLKVDENGKVASRSLVTRLGHGLDELALKLANRLRFKPAIDTADRPVPATVVWTFTFTLPQ